MFSATGLAFLLVLGAPAAPAPKSTDAAGPLLTAAAVRARIPKERERAGRVEGWSADQRTFGVCSLLCGSREEVWTIACSAATLAQDDLSAPLKSIDLDAWVALGLSERPAGALTLPPGAKAEGAVGFDAGDARATWALRVHHGALDARVVGGDGESYGRPAAYWVVAPDGRAAVVYTEYAADHGCGDRDGALVAWPSAGAEALVRHGLVLHRQKKFAQALAAYDAALTVDPASARAHYNKACAHGQLKQPEAAAEQVRWLLAHDAATYRPRVEADADFDSVRAAPVFAAALAASAAVKLRGTLRHTPFDSRRKSVESYRGVEFSLETADGPRPLGPTDAFPADALRAAAGRVVEVTCVQQPDSLPDPHESFPQGADGAAMPRPGKCEVQAITP